MTNTKQKQLKNEPFTALGTASLVLFLGLSFLVIFHIIGQHSDGSAYSKGYELGAMFRNLIGTSGFRNGIGLGSLLAVLVSWERNKSILWAIFHAVFGWIYVVYFALIRKGSAANNLALNSNS